MAQFDAYLGSGSFDLKATQHSAFDGPLIAIVPAGMQCSRTVGFSSDGAAGGGPPPLPAESLTADCIDLLPDPTRHQVRTEGPRERIRKPEACGLAAVSEVMRGEACPAHARPHAYVLLRVPPPSLSLCSICLCRDYAHRAAALVGAHTILRRGASRARHRHPRMDTIGALLLWCVLLWASRP